MISYYKLILIYINYKYMFNEISFVNIEINSLLTIMIYQLGDGRLLWPIFLLPYKKQNIPY